MVEVPEHLLRRSRERRAALGLGGGEAPSGESSETRQEADEAGPPAETEAATTPAPTAPSAPPAVEPEPQPPQPVPAYIQAAQQRHRLPWWSIPVFAALPLWAWIFLRTLSPPAAEADPLTEGEALYQTCAGCHGGSGQGGTGPPLEDGAVLETFPDYRDHMMWVRTGNQDWPAEAYGANDQPVDRSATMPGHPQFTDQELAQVVLYERQELSGEEIEEDSELMMIAEGELTFADVGVGELSGEAGFSEADLEGP